MEEFIKSNQKHDSSENSKLKSENVDTKPEAKPADDPHAGEESAIPGTNSNDTIGNAQSGAGVGGNKGRGTADFPNKNA